MEITRKVNQQTRYIIQKQEQDMEEMGCQHSACEVFHKKWRDHYGNCKKPIAPRTEYVIVDMMTDERLGVGEIFATKRDAIAELTRFLNRLTEIEWSQIAKAGA